MLFFLHLPNWSACETNSPKYCQQWSNAIITIRLIFHFPFVVRSQPFFCCFHKTTWKIFFFIYFNFVPPFSKVWLSWKTNIVIKKRLDKFFADQAGGSKTVAETVCRILWAWLKASAIEKTYLEWQLIFILFKIIFQGLTCGPGVR